MSLFGGIAENLKYIPYKIGEPKRLMSLLVGVVGLAAGYSLDGKTKAKAGWKMFMMTFGAVCLAAFVAGVVNPVTIYNRNTYGSSTGQTGLMVGQTDPWRAGSRSPPGAYYSAGYQPASSHADPLLPAMATSGGIPVPGVRAEMGPSEGAGGLTTGQTDPKYGRTATGLYYGAGFEPSRPPFYYGAPNVVGRDPLFQGHGQVPPSEGSIYIRDFGELEFNGGI